MKGCSNTSFREEGRPNEIAAYLTKNFFVRKISSAAVCLKGRLYIGVEFKDNFNQVTGKFPVGGFDWGERGNRKR